MCAECSTLRNQAQALLAENAALMERYEITERGRYAAERQVRALKAELHGSTSKENQKVKDVCAYHDEKWREAFPKARGLSYPLDGVNAKAVRRALRWGKKVDELKRTLDGAFASEFHRSKSAYLTLESVLRDENRIRAHLERAENPEPAKPQPRPQRLVADFAPDPVATVLAALEARGCSTKEGFGGTSWTAQCPAHEDRSPSLSIAWNGAGDDLLVHCFAGCPTGEVLDALGLSYLDLLQRDGYHDRRAA